MKMNFDFVGFRKISLIISAALIVLCVLLSFVMGVEMDISFKGGTMAKYSYTGTLDLEDVKDFAKAQLGNDVVVDLTNSGDQSIISLSKTDVLSPKAQEKLTEAFQKQYPDNKIVAEQINAVQPSMGRSFFAKCLLAVALAALFLILYVAYRFRKIGGFSAGLMAVFALVNDLAFAYLAFIIFQIPLNDNFVAVMLTILGYSLNDTIVVYDRVRENKGINPTATTAELVNDSLNVVKIRTFITTLTTFSAVVMIIVVAELFGLTSLRSFAIPMAFGLISGCISSLFISAPLWVIWKNHSDNKLPKATKKKGRRR